MRIAENINMEKTLVTREKKFTPSPAEKMAGTRKGAKNRMIGRFSAGFCVRFVFVQRGNNERNPKPLQKSSFPEGRGVILGGQVPDGRCPGDFGPAAIGSWRATSGLRKSVIHLVRSAIHFGESALDSGRSAIGFGKTCIGFLRPHIGSGYLFIDIL
jgi:hypothetical protein